MRVEDIRSFQGAFQLDSSSRVAPDLARLAEPFNNRIQNPHSLVYGTMGMMLRQQAWLGFR
jgi:hypothetical protein